MNKISKSELKMLITKSYDGRITALKMMKNGPSHVGGVLSSMEIVTVLYNMILKHNPKNPKWSERDRFILSAGHKSIAQYYTLQDQGYFEEEILWTYNRFDTPISECPDVNKIPGIEFPTGSLGHGLSAGSGMAIAAKIDQKDYRVFVLLGDGECAEGAVWEAAVASAHHKLDNLIAIVDRNGLQVNGPNKVIMDTSPLEDKFRSFGWEVITINGHDCKEIYETLIEVPFKKNKPSCIIADTIKCKGVSFAENKYLSHHCHWENEKIEKAINDIKNNKNKELKKIG